MNATRAVPRRFVQATEELRESNAWTNNEWLCRPDLVDAEQLLLVRANMDPGRCHPFHCHPHREEVIYVIHGRAEQWVEQEHRILRAGEVAHIPAGIIHATYNPHPKPVIFLAILSPAKLAAELEKDPDPCDVSDQEPWQTIRAGFKPCTLAQPAAAG